jgi:hypothetical protein
MKPVEVHQQPTNVCFLNKRRVLSFPIEWVRRAFPTTASGIDCDLSAAFSKMKFSSFLMTVSKHLKAREGAALTKMLDFRGEEGAELLKDLGNVSVSGTI